MMKPITEHRKTGNTGANENDDKDTEIYENSDIFLNPENATPEPTTGVVQQPEPDTEPYLDPTKHDPQP